MHWAPIAWLVAVFVWGVSSGAAAQAASPAAVRLDPIACGFQPPEPELVLVAPEPTRAMDALFAACGAVLPSDQTNVPDAAMLASCTPSRAVLVAFLDVLDSRTAFPSTALVDQLVARAERVRDPTDLLLLAELLKRLSRYELAATILSRIADEAEDPGIRALAIERLAAILANDDWDEDRVPDVDFATHVTLPRLPERSWSREVASRVLARAASSGSDGLRDAARARFGVSFVQEAPPASDEVSPPSIRSLVRRLPLATCLSERATAVALVRVRADGSVASASSDPCLHELLAGLTHASSGVDGGDAEARLIFVFITPR